MSFSHQAPHALHLYLLLVCRYRCLSMHADISLCHHQQLKIKSCIGLHTPCTIIVRHFLLDKRQRRPKYSLGKQHTDLRHNHSITVQTAAWLHKSTEKCPRHVSKVDTLESFDLWYHMLPFGSLEHRARNEVSFAAARQRAPGTRVRHNRRRSTQNRVSEQNPSESRTPLRVTRPPLDWIDWWGGLRLSRSGASLLFVWHAAAAAAVCLDSPCNLVKV